MAKRLAEENKARTKRYYKKVIILLANKLTKNFKLGRKENTDWGLQAKPQVSEEKERQYGMSE